MKKISLVIGTILMLTVIVSCNRTVSIIYETNGGTAVSSEDVGQLAAFEEPVTTKTGYSFDGWYKEASFDTLFDFSVGSSRNMTLYAKWTINQYTLSFETDNGQTIDAITDDYQALLSMPDDPEKEGYTFAGWYEDQLFENRFESLRMIANDTTLYAKWNPVIYVIEFMADGLIVDTRTVQHGESITNIPDIPEKVGYEAVWDVTDFESVENEFEVTAIYTLLSYTVTFIDQDDIVYDMQTIDYGHKVSSLAEEPSKVGYNFLGYSEDLNTLIVTEDIEITVLFTPITYTVTFKGYQGAIIESQTIQHGRSATAPDLDVPDGYTFVSWDVAFDDVTEALTVQAIFEPVEYLITLDANSGSFSNDLEILNISKDYGDKTGIPEQPTKDGYTFMGWFSNELGTGEQTLFTSLTTMPLDGLNLYAKWSLNNYTITYENTFDQPHGNQSNFNILTDTFVLNHASNRLHYTFAGWYDAEVDGTLVNEISKGTFENITLYARWTPVNYTITFDVDGDLSQVDIPYLDLIDIRDIPSIPTKTHYDDVLPTWSESPLDYQVIGDKTFTAIYTPNTYTISFDAQGGTSVDDISGLYGQTISLSETPIKAEHSFAGWFIDEALTTQYIFDTFESSITLYAKWTQYPVLEFYVEGMAISQISEAAGAPISKPSDPSLEHYVFDNWYDAETGGNVYVFDTMPAQDTIVYARWIPQNYTITFDIDGVLTEVEIPYLEVIEAQDVPSITSKANYDDVTAVWDNDPIGYQVVGHYTFTAQYTPNLMEVSFELNGGEAISDTFVSYNETLSAPATPQREGYSFVAWYMDESLIQIYDFNALVTTDLVLYATWERNYYSISVTAHFEKESSLDEGVMLTDGQSMTYDINNLIFEETVDFMRNFEGYEFNYYVIDQQVYLNATEIEITESMQIDIYYRRIIHTVTFLQDETLFSGENSGGEIVEFSVYYGEDLNETIPTLLEKSGYVASWSKSYYNDIREDTIVYAIYYDTSVKTINFSDRGNIRYIASQDNDEEIAIASSSVLWNLSRTGYKFMGWYTQETGGIKVEQSDLLYDNPLFTDNQSTLYARWIELPTFASPVITDVTVSVAGDEIIISWTMNPPTIDDIQPSSFDISLNHRVINIPSSIVTLANDTYTFVLNEETTNAQYFMEFEELLNAGTHRITVQAIGDDGIQNSSEESEVFEYAHDSIYDGDPSEVAVYDYFIVETFDDTIRYVFYANLNYEFSSEYTFEIISGDEFVVANGSSLHINDQSGSFKFRLIRSGYPTQVYDALVVQDVKQFEHGSNYTTYLDTQSAYLKGGTNNPYYVGMQNNYYLDLRILNNQGSRIDLEDTILSYELYLKNGETETLIPTNELAEYIEFFDGNQIRMSLEALNKTFVLKVKPKYQATQMSVNGGASVSFEFMVNDGYNAFTNEDLQVLFANMDVHTINIHANIEAALTTSQMNADGSPKNIKQTSAGINTGNVYARYSTTTDDDELTIEGNYMSVDGSNLPYSNSSSGSGTLGFAQSFEIMNVQIAVFNYNVLDTSLVDVNNNQFNVNNLTVIGNTVTPNINYSGTPDDILLQERLMSKNSGGYVGFIAFNGDINLTNIRIGYTLIGLTANGFGFNDLYEPMISNLNYVQIYESWANSLYAHGGGGFELSNSVIEQSGGAAIHVVDTTQGSGDYNPSVQINQTTTINNWISGEEAWFKAYGMSSVALQLKSGIEANIASTERSVIEMINNPVSGLASEMINLILLTEASSGANTYEDPVNEINQNGGSEINLLLEDGNGMNAISRSWDFMSSDPRVSSGQFGFPVGIYSETNAFIGVIGELMSAPYNLDQENATNLAILAGFYNLTAEQVVNVYGYASGYSTTFQEAITALYPGQVAVYPKYIEILAAVPVFDGGASTILLELK
jgi:uncharacterized repeat protein (TIGR02543 family)